MDGHSITQQAKSNYEILLYVPNIIGYVRLLLLVAAFLMLDYHAVGFIILYSLSIILDAFDGYAARKLGQCSAFGAWLDVIVDNVGRGLLWAHIHPMCSLITALEWLVFVCNHQLGDNWRGRIINDKKNCNKQVPPNIVTSILRNNFRNPLGVWVVSGLHVLPVWLAGAQLGVFESHLYFIPSFFVAIGTVILLIGRCIGFIAELWCIWHHIDKLLMV